VPRRDVAGREISDRVKTGRAVRGGEERRNESWRRAQIGGVRVGSPYLYHEGPSSENRGRSYLHIDIGFRLKRGGVYSG